MSFKDRLLGRSPKPVAPDPNQVPCTLTTCTKAATTYCKYRDQRQVPCGTSWCAEHSTVVQDRAYCRRHLSYALSQASDLATEMLPNVTSRAPSLVAWMSNELDSTIRETLSGLSPSTDTHITTSIVRPVYERFSATQRWLKVWKLLSNTEILTRVSLEVCDDEDSIVLVRVEDDIIGRHLPPWIGRDRTLPVDPVEDAASRQAFRDALMLDMRQGLANRRSLSLYKAAPILGAPQAPVAYKPDPAPDGLTFVTY